MKRLVLVLATALALTACGGKPTQSSTPAPVVTKANVTDIAFKLGCSYQKESEPEFFASESGTCGDYGMSIFSNSDAQKNWYETAKQFGGYYLVGNLWTVWSTNQNSITEAHSKLGGEVKP